MPEEQIKPEFKDTIFEEAYEKLRIRAESSNLITKVVTDMITEAEIECRLDDSYKEGVEKGSLNAKREMAKGLRDAGVSISIISKQSGLSEEEIKTL